MGNKFATTVVALILILMVLFAFQTFYKPPAGQAAGETQRNSLEPVNLQLASSWQVPHTNLTFTHNVSIVGGKRADIATFYNPDRTSKRVSLLVFVPKKIARSVGEISSSRPLQVINEDPCGYAEFDLPPGTTQFAAAYAALVSGPAGGTVMVPLAAASRADIEQLCSALGEAGDYIESLTTEQVMDFALGLTVNPASLVAGGFRQLAAQEPQATTELSAVNIRVSELAPRGSAEFNLPRLPRGTLVWRIEESRTSEFTGRLLTIYRPDPNSGRILASVDLNREELDGGRFPFSGSSILAFAVFSDTARPGQMLARVPVNIIIDHFDGIKIAPLRLAKRRGGEFLLLLNNLPYAAQIEVEHGRNNQKTPVTLNPRAGAAQIIYVDNEKVENEGLSIRQGQSAMHDIVTIGEGGPEGLEPLFALPSQSSDDCSSKFCTCREARATLARLNEKVKADYAKYDNGQLALENGKFCEGFLFGLAEMESCELGIDFVPDALGGNGKPISSAMQVIKICTSLESERATATAHQNFFATSLVEGVTSEQVIQAAKQQFLCHDPAGLPSSQPDGFCSRDTRVS